MNARLDQIQNRLDHHFSEEMGVPALSMDLPRWACLTDLGPSYVNTGWAFPVSLLPNDRAGDLHGEALAFWIEEYTSQAAPDHSPMLFVYCPEVMRDSTMHLNDEELDQYLTAIEYMMDRYVAIRLTVLDPEERLRLIESDLYDINPARLDLVTAVQMGSLPPVVTP